MMPWHWIVVVVTVLIVVFFLWKGIKAWEQAQEYDEDEIKR